MPGPGSFIAPAVERAINARDRGAYPGLEPERVVGVRLEDIHLDDGHRDRDARRRRLWHERTFVERRKSGSHA